MPERPNAKIDVLLNPLVFHEAEQALEDQPHEINAESILRHLCSIDLSSEPDAFLERYGDLRQINSAKLWITPVSPQILRRFVFPLRDAFNSYLLGAYLAAIANSGYVAEMVALLKHQIANRTVNGAPAKEALEKKIYGKTFENLGQERRIDVLKAWGLLSDETKRAFSEIRNIRRSYLHFSDTDDSNLQTDALKCVGHAEHLLVWLMGLHVLDGKLAFSAEFQVYLRQEGLLTDES